ncbi:MAG: bifunctional 2-polyprenyl-6-hydroxyphenol methylase/3-demethylubiquinol 3-O-methyltransferase UbiG [Alphaproteobacteria bacterium]|nr:MAG: bifunctional 2-polyprenyl-6-hydroxyphenol methylase/3-demethylubiquinol 3-O-methyltransferase UbiG [Alphaproteobacteria bacterium]
MTTTIDPADVQRFASVAARWWDTTGPFAPLHALNPARLAFVRERITAALGQVDGVSILDIGCGGGLMAEPLARLGATVTGVDGTAEGIAAARQHAAQAGLTIDYRQGAAEDLVAEGLRFDVVLALEVVEHVANVPAFLACLRALVRPGGVVILSTLNRTWHSWAMAIAAAEYVLRIIPRGTHDWRQFLTPAELVRGLRAEGLQLDRITGLSRRLDGTWVLSDDRRVNYLVSARA